MEANPVVALALALGLIILGSRIGGSIARRLGQPRVLGELIIGVILGPTLLDFFHWPLFENADIHLLEETIAELAELGVILLMFLVGLEVNLRELLKVGKVGVFAGIAGALLPVALAYPVIVFNDYSWQPALFGGVVVAATSVSISAQVLLELGHLQSKVGNALLATALIDDVLAILLVSITIAVIGGDGSEANAGDIIIIVIQMAVYLVAAFTVAWFVLPRVIDRLSEIPDAAQSYGISALAIVAALLFAWSAEELGGVAMITGSFIAGMGLTQTKDRVKHEIEEATAFISYAFFVPIFFLDVGLRTELSVATSALGFLVLLLLGAIISKVAGCGIGARLGGFNNEESLQLGVCMISRGEVGLIIASLGLSTGVFIAGDPLFSSLFMVIIVTTLVTPLLVRRIFPRDPATPLEIEQSSVETPEGAQA